MEIKEELTKRYCYIYEKAEDILAPYMEEHGADENMRFKQLSNEKTIIGLGQLPHDLLINLESFLLSDISYQESEFYNDFENKMNSTEYLKKVKQGLVLLKKNNDTVYSPFLQINLNVWTLLSKVRRFIDCQLADPYNRVDKLHALDEYFKIARYTNDGKVWVSGYEQMYWDFKNKKGAFYASHLEAYYSREKDDTGLEESKFVLYLTTNANLNKENNAILTEKEKQDIYLKYHDELPWNMEKTCELEEEYLPLMIELRMQRPEHTSPCGENFYVKEEEIFIDPTDHLYRYYQLCPHCGYIVNIRKETLPKTVKQRIEEKCEKNPDLFRKMYLYSELYSLANDEQKRVLKKFKR